MTESPYTAARPSEGTGKTSTTVTFWAELWRPMETNSHGEMVVSPKFGTEPECVSWVRAHRQTFDQVGMWKRVSRNGNDYTDEPLYADEAPRADPERIHKLVGDLKEMLAEKSRQLDKQPTAKPYARVSEFNPIARPLTYDEVYDEHGEPR